MTDRPIIFSGPMVRALLEGRKTQTRRLLKRNPNGTYPIYDKGRNIGWSSDPWPPGAGLVCHTTYRPGDRLYVREAHALVPSSAYRMSPGVPYAVNDEDGSQACVYREGWERSKPSTGWRPSIHMPRWASRLTLTVTEVRVQRLQEISTDDAIAEGVSLPWSPGGTLAMMAQGTAKSAYRDLWNSLHGPDAWDANPWVVAVTFTVDRRNIDSLST